jgi:hypothetical protein
VGLREKEDLHVGPKQTNKDEILNANKDVLSVCEEGIVLQEVVSDQDHNHGKLCEERGQRQK